MDLKNALYDFVKALKDFSYEMSSLDRVWHILFPDQNGVWNRLSVVKYKRVFYINHVNGDDLILEVQPGKSVQPTTPFGGCSPGRAQTLEELSPRWEPLIKSADKWLDNVRKDWIKANKRVYTEYPFAYRYGTVAHSLVRNSLKDIYRLDKDLGKVKTRRMVRLVENGFFMNPENTETCTMTAAQYFQYCRIAYIAGQRHDETLDKSMSGREMYARYADGRHEGLLDIDPDSEQEFADWLDGTHPKRGGGGHPWEIKRGGNTTHIDLAVLRPSLYRKKGFKVELQGESISRMAETIRMLLAIHEAGLPITIANPENVRKRLLGQDNIGIIPCYTFRHRADQYFAKDDEVFDVMHYSDLGRYKRRITPFISWKPLPLLKPREI